ncbi:hypothetical protein COT94_02360 [Candidatus Falkowbacteria bacterium CG10_big_fil_rev_8_21_14_0_10_37_14]|uniref:histidine kinase n=1 Tax=Candidatus Falkowbacteria bacterium CG10_big_fil_rev_8_21_14_0_10_37_14 TaxID=1974561 RepID=A0A2M6WTG0_9BACT|nr:PAS domain S-box protein [Candidatus Falkowbacteria bacterium]PIT96083.1 MAG: hypothetical protein COT94_02360 [Candidatus Falkowbacteria bacterium CG10_big_fil_rev_8_21_14_0_10_37_14]
MKNFSVKKKITLSILFTGLFIGSVVSASVFLYLREALISNQINLLSQVVIEQNHETEQTLANNLLFTKMLATRTKVQEYLEFQTESRRIELDEILKEYHKEDANFLAIYLLDEKGTALISTDSSFVNKDYSFRDYFKNAKTGKITATALWGVTSKQFGYYFSQPIYNQQGKFIGAMVIKTTGEDLTKQVLESELSKQNDIMLVDRYGIILSTNKQGRFLKSLGALTEQEQEEIKSSKRFGDNAIDPLQYNEIQEAVRNYADYRIISIYDQEDSDQEYFFIYRLAGEDLFLVVEAGLENLLVMFSFTLWMVTGLIAVMVLLMSIMVYWLLFKFLKPLYLLREAANQIGQGDFSYKIKTVNDDEFGDLAKSFNLMNGQLKDLYSGMDKKIKDRTKDLNEKNKNLDKQQEAVLNILEDVAVEKKKAESLADDLEKFRLAVDNSSEQIVITDKEGLVLYGNKAMQTITGYSTKEVLGTKAGKLWRLPMPKQYYENFWDTIKNKKQPFIGVIQNKRKNGEEYDAAISVYPIMNSDNEIVYFVAIERDVTKEKQVDRAKTEFVSLASHQLRTPLSTVNWYVEMLLSGDAGELNEEQKKYLAEVYQGNQRMVDLVNSLLNVSRIELGKLAIKPEFLNIAELAQSAVAEQQPQIMQKEHKLITNFVKDAPKLMADPKLLRMVFQNLLSNAIKYTPPKGRIEMKVEYKTKQKAFVITVADNGIGIPTEQCNRIFTKMFRADNVKEADTEGTGLGLYIIKSIIEGSGGSITFQSVENEGTKFTATLPLEGMKEVKGDKSLI